MGGNNSWIKRWLIMALWVTIFNSLLGCVPNGELNSESPRQNQLELREQFTMGALLASPEMPGAVYNEAIKEVFRRVEDEMGVGKEILASDEFLYASEALQYFAENLYKLVVVADPALTDSVKVITEQYPETKFVVFESEDRAFNLIPLHFRFQDAWYLTGALAAYLTKNGQVGIVNGPGEGSAVIAIQKGINYVKSIERKEINVEAVEVGAGDDLRERVLSLFPMPLSKGQELANTIELPATPPSTKIPKNPDIILFTKPEWNQGVLAAVSERGGLPVTLTYQKDGYDQGIVFLVAEKEPKEALYQLVLGMTQEQTTGNKVYSYGLGNINLFWEPIGAELSFVKKNSPITPAIIEKVNAVKDKLLKGEIGPFE